MAILFITGKNRDITNGYIVKKFQLKISIPSKFRIFTLYAECLVFCPAVFYLLFWFSSSACSLYHFTLNAFLEILPFAGFPSPHENDTRMLN